MKRISLQSLLLSLSLWLLFSLSAFAENLFNTAEPMNLDGKINVIVEISASSTTPFNVGVIPATTYEGKPLQVILLSEAANAGSIQKASAIGVFDYIQEGVIKKMVIAVSDRGPFANMTNLELLNTQFPEILGVIQKKYNGNQIIIDNTKNRLDAVYLVGDSILGFANANISESDCRPLDKDGNPTLLIHPASKNIHK